MKEKMEKFFNKNPLKKIDGSHFSKWELKKLYLLWKSGSWEVIYEDGVYVVAMYVSKRYYHRLCNINYSLVDQLKVVFPWECIG